MTAKDIIKYGMLKLQALDVGRDPTSAESDQGLFTLNGIVQGLALQRTLIWGESIVRVTFPGAQQSYTIGPTGDLKTDINGNSILRPLTMPRANIVATNFTPNGHYPVSMLDQYEWLGIPVPFIGTNLPFRAYYDRGAVSTPVQGGTANAGLGTVYFNPYPVAPLPDFEFATRVQIAKFADLTTDYYFPPGYDMMLVFTWAEHMPELAGPQVNFDEIKRLAKYWRRMVGDNNAPPPPRSGQDWGLGKYGDDRRTDFNYLTGEVL